MLLQCSITGLHKAQGQGIDPVGNWVCTTVGQTHMTGQSAQNKWAIYQAGDEWRERLLIN